MSDKEQWPRAEALAVAEEMQSRLAPACERIAIVGSGVTWKDGRTEQANSEKDVFDLCGVPYLEPHER